MLQYCFTSTALLLSHVDACPVRPGPFPGALCCTTFVLVSFAGHSFGYHQVQAATDQLRH